MGRAPDLRETVPLPEQVTQAGLNGDLILFVGAGVSRLVGLPSWSELAAYVLEDLRKAGFLNYSEIEQLKNQEPKKLLSIARLIAEENGTKLDITKHLSGKSEGHSIYKTINDIGCSCVTTNYDELLAPRYMQAMDGSQTPVTPHRVAEREKFFARLLDEPGTVVHLHGCITKPQTMIVTTKDYLEHYDHENVQNFLGELFARKTVVFLGYGLEEAEILEHILRRGRVSQTQELKRFAIQGFFRSQQPLYEKLHNYYEKSFGVQLLGFIRDHEDYVGLENTVKAWAEQLEIHKPPLATDAEFLNEVLSGE